MGVAFQGQFGTPREGTSQLITHNNTTMATPSTNGAVPSKSPVSNDSHDRQVPNIESDIQLRAFIGLQRLIVARYEQELELKNKLLLEGTKTEENCDIATLDEVHELVHKYCESPGAFSHFDRC